MIRWFVVLMMTGLAGCASKAPAPVADSQSPARIEALKAPQPLAPLAPLAPTGKLHVVKKGDTLLSIARENGLNPRDIAAWNNLDNSNRISVGQQLRLSPPMAQPAPTPSPDGAEVRPIAAVGGVVARPLDSSPPPEAIPPAPTSQPLSAGNTDTLKRVPKGGKLPYSEENLARLKGATLPVTAQPQAAQTAGPVEKPAAPAAPAALAAPAAQLPTGGGDWVWPATGKLLAGFSDGNAGAQNLNRGVDIAGNIGDPVLAAAAGKVIFVGVYPKHGNLVVLLHADGYSSVYAHNSRVLVKEGQMIKRGQRIAELGNSDADLPKLHFELRQQGKPVDPLKFLPPR